MNRDKNLSGMLILFTLGFILYEVGSGDSLRLESTMTLKDTLSHILNYYMDIVIIIYIFTCLQIAGYLELKYSQDFLTMSIISILLTPFATFFVYRREEDDD